MLRIVLYLSLFTFTTQITFAQNICGIKMLSSNGATYYKCPDGTVSFAQPPSTPLSISPLTYPYDIYKLANEVYSAFDETQEETFHKVKRAKPEICEEKTSSRPTSPKNSENENKKDNRSFKDSIKEKIQKIGDYLKQVKEAEGYCGATAASNVFYAFCNKNITVPMELARNYFQDVAPGVLPGTLKKGLNKLFTKHSDKCPEGSWHYYNSKNKIFFMDSLLTHTRNKTPSIALISNDDGQSLHYVTVISVAGYHYSSAFTDIDHSKCIVTYNDSNASMQTKTTCANFAKLSESATKSDFFKLFLPSYVRLVFIPK